MTKSWHWKIDSKPLQTIQSRQDETNIIKYTIIIRFMNYDGIGIDI